MGRDTNHSTPKALLDLLIILDATGSMGHYIEAAKKSIIEVCCVLRASGRLKEAVGLQVGLLAYRDYPKEENEFVLDPHPFTYNLEEIEGHLNQLKAYGGGKPPEAFGTALEYAYYKMEGWRDEAVKAIVVITDAAPHGINEDEDEYPEGFPLGEKVEDPLQLMKDLAETRYSVFTLACEPTLSKSTKYAVDFYRALSDRTLGRFCPLADHRVLPAYIIGTLLEKIDLRMLSQEYEDYIRKKVFDEGLSIDQVVHDLHEELKSKEQKVTNMQTGELYKVDPDASENYKTFIESKSLADARTRLKDVNARITDKDLKTIQKYKRELSDSESNPFLVNVRFKNMQSMGNGRIVLQTFDDNLRAMYPEDVVAEKRPVEKKFRVNNIVNFTATFGRITKTFCRVFVDDTTIEVDAYFA